MTDYFVCTLLNIIHAILTPKPKSEFDSDDKKCGYFELKNTDSRDRVRNCSKKLSWKIGVSNIREMRKKKDTGIGRTGKETETGAKIGEGKGKKIWTQTDTGKRGV